MSREARFYHKSYQRNFKKRKKRFFPKPYHQNYHIQRVSGNSFFKGSLANNMRFGAKGHDLSGHVSRKLVVIHK